MTTEARRRPDSPETPDEQITSKRTHRPRRARPRRVRVKMRTPPITAPVEPPLAIGSFAVYPPHGVAEVMAIEEAEISGIRDTFYRLRVVGSGARLLIPERKLITSGMREVIGRERVDEVMSLLRRRADPPSGSNWSKWYRTFNEKVQTGSIFDAAEVFRDIYALKQRKSLSPAERHLFDIAQHLVVTELITATGDCPDEIERQVLDAVTPSTRPPASRADGSG